MIDQEFINKISKQNDESKKRRLNFIQKFNNDDKYNFKINDDNYGGIEYTIKKTNMNNDINDKKMGIDIDKINNFMKKQSEKFIKTIDKDEAEDEEFEDNKLVKDIINENKTEIKNAYIFLVEKGRSNKCIYCDKTASFNFIGNGNKGVLLCGTHKKNGMLNMYHTCQFNNCTKCASYNFEGEKGGKFCNKHKKDGMINIYAKICITCPNQASNKNYKGYCLRCYILQGNEVVRNYKTKELAVADFILDNFKDYDWVLDKRVKGVNRRPDLLLDLGHQILVVEVDENCHKGKRYNCENKRICEILEALKDDNDQECIEYLDENNEKQNYKLGIRPIIVIRFNPDSFTNNFGETIRSAWGQNSKGISVINNKDDWSNRLSILSDHIKYWINNESDKTLEIKYLFYDGYNYTNCLNI